MSNVMTKNEMKPNWFSRNKKTIYLMTMVLPGTIWLLALRYLPMFGIVLAFKDYKINSSIAQPTFFDNLKFSKWVGFNNFKFMFNNTSTLKVIRNTLGYNMLWIIMGLVIAVAFAVMLNEVTNKFMAKTYQTLMFFPYFLSWVVAGYFLYAFLADTNGLIPNMQRSMGQQPISWYYTIKPWPYLLTLVSMWKNLGYSTVLYLAAITGIDTAQYEAASIDGASKWKQVFYITIPNIRSMIIILFIMNIGKIFNADFGLFYSVPMNSSTLQPVTEVIDTLVYRMMSVSRNTGMSTAVSLVQNIVGFIAIMISNTIVRKVDEDSSLF